MAPYYARISTFRRRNKAASRHFVKYSAWLKDLKRINSDYRRLAFIHTALPVPARQTGSVRRHNSPSHSIWQWQLMWMVDVASSFRRLVLMLVVDTTRRSTLGDRCRLHVSTICPSTPSSELHRQSSRASFRRKLQLTFCQSEFPWQLINFCDLGLCVCFRIHYAVPCNSYHFIQPLAITFNKRYE